MRSESLSPELALVDPELGARAREALPSRGVLELAPRRPTPVAPSAPAAPSTESHRPYPMWARVTASLWLVVLGILIGGAAIPHAQDKPRVIPPREDPTICKDETQRPAPELPRPGRSGL